MSEICAQRGHCWHEPDGSVYSRHFNRPQDTVTVTCCDCEAHAVVPMHAASTSPPTGPSQRKVHGKFRPHPPKAA